MLGGAGPSPGAAFCIHADFSKNPIQALETLRSTLKVQPSDWEKVLPRIMFSQTGDLLRHIRRWAKVIGKVAYLRIMDKGPGLIRGFCRALMTLMSLLCLSIERGYILIVGREEVGLSTTM